MNKPTPLKVSAPVRILPSRPKTSLDKTQSRGEERRTAGAGLHSPVGAFSGTALTSELFGVLDRGVAGVQTESRNGHFWPRPRKAAIERLVERYDEATCRQAAREAREIVLAQDFAPNITGLFAKKCADIEAERQSVRDEIRQALA